MEIPPSKLPPKINHTSSFGPVAGISPDVETIVPVLVMVLKVMGVTVGVSVGNDAIGVGEGAVCKVKGPMTGRYLPKRLRRKPAIRLLERMMMIRKIIPKNTRINRFDVISGL